MAWAGSRNSSVPAYLPAGAHLASAETMLRRLLERELNEGEQEYLDVLTDLIEKYEADREPIPDASEADVLRLLMESNGLHPDGGCEKARHCAFHDLRCPARDSFAHQGPSDHTRPVLPRRPRRVSARGT